jgi:hypothetical protein
VGDTSGERTLEMAMHRMSPSARARPHPQGPALRRTWTIRRTWPKWCRSAAWTATAGRKAAGATNFVSSLRNPRNPLESAAGNAQNISAGYRKWKSRLI